MEIEHSAPMSDGEFNTMTNKFTVFNNIVKQEISNNQKSEAEINENEDDDFNYTLKKTLEEMLMSILTDKNSSLVSNSHREQAYVSYFPTIPSFQGFIKELFEIVHSPEKLNFALKFIIDYVVNENIEMYSKETVSRFVSKLTCADNTNYYPDDYSDDSIYISKFCLKYIYVSNFKNDKLQDYKRIFSSLSFFGIPNKTYSSIFGISEENLILPNFFETNQGWSSLIFLVDSLKWDKTVLLNGYYSELYENTVFCSIRYQLMVSGITDKDFLKFLFEKMSYSLSTNESERKTPSGDWKYISIFLKQHPYFKSLKPYFKEILAECMLISFQSLAESYRNVSKEAKLELSGRFQNSNNNRWKSNKNQTQNGLKAYENKTTHNKSYVLVALTLANENLISLNDLIEEFSKGTGLNQCLKNELIHSHKEFLNDNILLGPNTQNFLLGALASASSLTLESDDTNVATEQHDFLNNKIQKSKSPSIDPVNVQNTNSNTDEYVKKNIPLNFYPQIIIISQLFERGSFAEVFRYINYFKYCLVGDTTLADTAVSVFTLYWECIEKNGKWSESAKNSSIINMNSFVNFPSDEYIKKWEYWGNLETQEYSKSSFFKDFSQLLMFDISPECVVKMLNLLHSCFQDCLSSNDYDENFWIGFVIQYLVPTILKNPPEANIAIYKIMKHFSINQRFAIYVELENQFLKNDHSYKPLLAGQSKQIKRFLKVINVDTISEQSKNLAKLANTNPFTVFDECLKQAESYDMISSLIVESAHKFSEFSLDVLQYCCMKRFKLERAYMSQDQVNVLPWLAKLTTFIISVYNLKPEFNIEYIFNYAVEKILNFEYQGLYILKEFLSKTTSCVYLDEPQYDVAVLLAASSKTKLHAKSKLLGIKDKKSLQLLSLFKQKKDGFTVAQKLFQSLMAWILDVFYDSFELISSITSKYDTIVMVLRLIISFMRNKLSSDDAQVTIDVTNFKNQLVIFPIVPNSWRRVLFFESSISNDMSYLNFNLCPDDSKELVSDFWKYSLTDLAYGATKFTDFPKVDLKVIEKNYNNFLPKIIHHSSKSYGNEGLKYFLEECILKNSIMGVAEAIYSAEFLVTVLDYGSLVHILTNLFTRDYLKRLLISISKNETLFYSVFVNRLFVLLNNYESNLPDDKTDEFKKNFFYWTKSFVFEICELILDSEYLNSRAAIQIVSKAVNNILGIDILLDVLLKAIEKKLNNESREELIAPLTSLNGFTKTNLKRCCSIEFYLGYVPEDEDVDIMLNIFSLNNKLVDSQSLEKERDEQILDLQNQQKDLLKKVELKKRNLQKEIEAKLKREIEEKEKADEAALRNKRKLEDADENVTKRRKFDYDSETLNGKTKVELSTDSTDKTTKVFVAPKGRFEGTGDTEDLRSSSKLSLPNGPRVEIKESIPGPEKAIISTPVLKNASQQILSEQKPPIVKFKLSAEKALLLVKNILAADRFTGVFVSKLFHELHQEKLFYYLLTILNSKDVDFVEFMQELLLNIFEVNFPNSTVSTEVKKIISSALVSLDTAPEYNIFLTNCKQSQTPSSMKYDPYSKISFFDQIEAYKKNSKHNNRSNEKRKKEQSKEQGKNVGSTENKNNKTYNNSSFDNHGRRTGQRNQRNQRNGYGHNNSRNSGYRY